MLVNTVRMSVTVSEPCSVTIPLPVPVTEVFEGSNEKEVCTHLHVCFDSHGSQHFNQIPSSVIFCLTVSNTRKYILIWMLDALKMHHLDFNL